VDPIREGSLIYFLGDAHLGASGAEMEDRKKDLLIEFLARAGEDADSIYIMGDLFDFWFEYSRVVPKGHFKVLKALSNLVDNGIRITMLLGNHDYWVGDYISEEVGISVVEGPVELKADGRRICLLHGDGIVPEDKGYRALRMMVRNPIVIKLFKWVHPDVGMRMARLFSAASRGEQTEQTKSHAEQALSIMEDMLQDGYDAVIAGHVHYPMIKTVGDKRCILTGDWITHMSYVTLDNGEFRLAKWPADKP
jgi:UDP-2,3-diacylglucosamine hydrolase